MVHHEHTQHTQHSQQAQVDSLSVAIQRNGCDLRAMYQQFSTSMGKVVAEMEMMKKTMNREHQHNQQCISQLTQQMMLLTQTQLQHREVLAAMKRILSGNAHGNGSGNGHGNGSGNGHGNGHGNDHEAHSLSTEDQKAMDEGMAE